MNISRAAKLAGVNVETIRYYQRRGLIPVPAKSLGSHRRYPGAIIERIRFIKRVQAWGFSLDEIALLLQPPQTIACARVQELAQEKVRALHGQIRDLDKKAKGLESLLDQCRQQPGCAQCPLRAHALC